MATFTVTNTADSGAGSLRQAILDANAADGRDVIVFDASFDGGAEDIIRLTSGQIEASSVWGSAPARASRRSPAAFRPGSTAALRHPSSTREQTLKHCHGREGAARSGPPLPRREVRVGT